MHRNTSALASLTATYDSDADSDLEDEDYGTILEVKPVRSVTTTPVLPTIQAEIVKETFSFTATFSKNDTSTTEMGHITDEEQSNVSEKDEDSDDEDENNQGNRDPSLSKNSVQIPPEPKGRCSSHLQEKFGNYYEKMTREGLDMNVVIQNQKQFRNPSIYEKLIQFCQIDELGTNYSPEIYDPSKFGPTSYYEDLAKAQKAEMDKRQKEQKERTKVEFITGTAKKLGSGEGTITDDAKKRKSKWDVGAMHGVVPLATLLKPAQVMTQPPGIAPLTTVATGTKAMVISAFGTIAKKSKQ